MKLLVIGIDGATLDVMNPMMSEGKLPNIKKIADQGICKRMLSVYPPITYSAWTSFKTGLTPGEHGVFGFVEGAPYVSEETKVVNTKRRAFWDDLSDAGYKVGIVNVPTTYPPSKVNGVMISGLGTPSLRSNFTYPTNLKSKISWKFDVFPLKSKNLVDKLIDAEVRITSTVWYLHNQQEFDFFMVNFQGADIIQHANFGKEQALVEKMYSAIDYCIGDILSEITPDNIIIVSDHGLGPCQGEVRINEWLDQLGFLRLKKTPGYKNSFRTWMQENIWPLFHSTWITSLIKKKVNPAGWANLVDWENTVAYAGGYLGKIYVNKKGRELKGVVTSSQYNRVISSLINELNSWSLVEKVYKADELYQGKYQDLAPDLTVIFNEGWADFPGFGNGSIIYPSRRRGDHRMQGIFISTLKEVKIDCITDVAPVIKEMYKVEY